jgi:hypothetical protein
MINVGDAGILARLPFAGGELLLCADRTLQVVPTDALRQQHRAFAQTTDDKALKWGTSLVVGLAAAGTAAYMRGWRPVGWAFFGLSGLSGVLGRNVRRAAQNWETIAFEPHPLDKVMLSPEPDSALRLELAGSTDAPPWTLRLEPGEFDAAAANRFLRAVWELSPP